jgi:hypothetical protein
MRIEGGCFVDNEGRRLLLRGVNLGGSSKVPATPNGATHMSEHFFEHREISFVGRPFPLHEADEHFTRLREWGFTFIRFIVTWEAIEHDGPGQYDREYLDYLSTLFEKAGEYGMTLVIDPHQDVWSRFTGGDGAPGWTLEAAGFEPRNFQQTGAAVVHQAYGEPYPWYIWPSNWDKLATATMFTLFFAGNDFAPATCVDGEPIQEYLQRHYIGALQQIVSRTRNMNHIAGYETMNEPEPGWIGVQDITLYKTIRRNGPTPNPWQSILLGSGYPQAIDFWKVGIGLHRVGRQWLNRERIRAWQKDRECLWRENGVWDIDGHGNPRLLRPDHFASVGNRPVDFSEDYFLPFIKRYIQAIRSVKPEATVIICPPPFNDAFSWEKDDAGNIVYAPHWYDFIVLVRKKFISWLALDIRSSRFILLPPLIRRSLSDQLNHFRHRAQNQLGGVPVYIGEIGIPFDMYKAMAYKTGDFSAQERALDRSFRAVEDTMVNVTIWNYTADNDNARGDQWNGEDFSIFSRDQQVDRKDVNSGGRALSALLRPYPKATAGELMELSFDMKKRLFRMKYRHNTGIEAATEIFVPRFQYPGGYRVAVSDGIWEQDAVGQTLKYWHTTGQSIHEITIYPQL